MWYNYTVGLLTAFGCFLEPGSLTTDFTNGDITANKLPADFEKYIVKHIEARIKGASEPTKSLIQQGKLEIDNCFAAAA